LLGGGAGRLEYLRTRELLARYLPPAPVAVLDIRVGVDWSVDESDEAPAEKVPSKEAQA
jgi:hypothetical protein